MLAYCAVSGRHGEGRPAAMKACSKCPERHAGAEAALSRKLSCTEVKRFWIAVRKEHQQRYGHMAEIELDDAGVRFCARCKRKLIFGIAPDSLECLHGEASSP